MEVGRVIHGGTTPNLSSKVEQQKINASVESTNILATFSQELGKSSPELAEKNLTKEETKKTVDALNHLLMPWDSHLKFIYHEKLDEYYVAIVDERTNEVIREIPPKKLMDLKASIRELIGIIIDKKV